MKRCVAYCRVSTKSDDQVNSIEAQKAYYTELFKKGGYNPAEVGILYKKGGVKEKINGIFADEGISGTSLKRREAFKTMMEYAKKKAFDVIYVKSVSRFARSVEDGTRALKDLKELGIGVFFEDIQSNSLDSRNEFIITQFISIAQEESRIKSENIKWGIRRLQEKGGWNAGIPYGYNINEGFLSVDDKKAEKVRQIYDLFLNEGYGIGKIARYLNDNQIPTQKGTKWSQIQVARLLDNEIYVGIQRSHTEEMIDINRKIMEKVDEEEQIVHEKEELRIIDKATFEKVQAERKKRCEMFSKGTHHSNTHLFSTLIYCGHCGGAYKRKKRHTYNRKDGTSKDVGYEWTCGTNDMYGKAKCGHRNMIIEDKFIEDVKAEILQLKKEDLSKYFDLYLKVNFDYEVSAEEVKRLNIKKELIEKVKKQLRLDKASELIDEKEYVKEFKQHQLELAGVDAEINRIEQHEVEIGKAKAKYKEFLHYIKEVDINNLTNATLKKLFSKIVIKDVNFKGIDRMTTYHYNFMDMSLLDLKNKAIEKGYNVEWNVLGHKWGA